MKQRVEEKANKLHNKYRSDFKDQMRGLVIVKSRNGDWRELYKIRE